MSLWRKRNVHHNGQNQPKWFNMTALANNDLSIKSKEHMTPEEEFNCIEMESKVKQDYVRAIKERTWVGLTPLDWRQISYSKEFRIGAIWAEAKLRSKNT